MSKPSNKQLEKCRKQDIIIITMAYKNQKKPNNSFRDFSLNLKNGSVGDVVFLFGEEEFLIEWAAKEIIKKYVKEASYMLDFDKPEEDAMSVEAIISSAETFPMLSEKRVVWIKDYPPLYKKNCAGFGEAELKRIGDYIKSPNKDAVIIFSAASSGGDSGRRSDKKTELYSLLIKEASAYDLCRLDAESLKGFINKRFKAANKAASPATVRYLIDVSGYNNKDSEYHLFNLEADIKKIIALSGDEVTERDVSTAVLGDMDTYIFDFLDRVSAGRKDEAYRLMHNMLRSGSDVFEILATLVGQFELMTEVKELRSSGMGLTEITKEMGIHEFRVKKALASAERFSLEKLREVLCGLYDMDANIKKGDIQGNIALELLIGRI